MTSSLLVADRMMHLRIVVLALICAILVAGIGIASRAAGSQTDRVTVVKPAKPMTAATAQDHAIR
jgi:hypothetical protein